MQKDDRLRKIVSECPLVNADGQSGGVGCADTGLALPERVAGIDLFVALLGMAEERGYGVYFLGATHDIVAATVRRRAASIRTCG